VPAARRTNSKTTPQPTQPTSATSAAVNVLQPLDSCHISEGTSAEPHPSTSTAGDSTIICKQWPGQIIFNMELYCWGNIINSVYIVLHCILF